MLDHIHVGLLTAITPTVRTIGILEIGVGPSVPSLAFAAEQVVAVVAVAVGDLALGDDTPSTIGPLVGGCHVIENVALVVRVHASAIGDDLSRRLVTEGPHHLVHGMDALLDVAVAGQPGEVHPVAHLPLEIAHAVFALRGRLHRLHGAGQVGAVHGQDLTDLAFVDALEELLLREGIAPAVARHQVELGFLGHADRLHHVTDAGAVSGHRLLAEDVLLLLDRITQVGGTESRRRGQQHHVHTGVDHLLVGVETDEALGGLHLHAAGELLVQAGVALLHLILKGIAHGHEDQVLVGLQRVAGGTGATPAAAHKADAKGVGVGGKGAISHQQGRRGKCQGCGG